MKFLWVKNEIFVGLFCLLNPDPYSGSGYGSTDLFESGSEALFIMLYSFFAQPMDGKPEPGVLPPWPSRWVAYDRESLLQLGKSPLCRQLPAAWQQIAATYPGIVKREGREGPTSKHFLREMASLRKQEAAKEI
jgi:hypothetical protein